MKGEKLGPLDRRQEVSTMLEVIGVLTVGFLSLAAFCGVLATVFAFGLAGESETERRRRAGAESASLAEGHQAQGSGTRGAA